MIKRIGNSFLLAIHNIRSHFFHTVLSVLGIVIGVAALVAILSLIDGAEKFAKEQITKTTSLNSIGIHTETHKVINDVRVKRDSISPITYVQFQAMMKSLSKPAEARYYISGSDQIKFADNPISIGTKLLATGKTVPPGMKLEVGTEFSEDNLNHHDSVAIVNHAFIEALKLSDKDVLDKVITLNNNKLHIIGVLKKDDNKSPLIIFPITILSNQDLKNNPPEIILNATTVEDVPVLKEEITTWLKKEFPNAKDGFHVFTNELRVKQAAQGFLLFRVVMGMIVGISVLVGGIGVMNVLLISVTERTVEIGIRKAVGANRRDIILQFLAESITVSAFGSFLGLVFGILGTMVMVPVIKAITKVPFQAEYTLNTLTIISVIALAVGIIFGTYPAIRASRLDPVEAIRRE